MSELIILYENDLHCSDHDRIEYVMDEKAIFSDLHLAMNWPLRVFNLKGMGIDQDAFIKYMASTFQNLAWDEYDVRRERMKLLHDTFPHKERRLRLFNRDYYQGRCDISAIADLIEILPREKKREFEAIVPHRRRSFARFRVRKLSRYTWNLTRIPAGSYSQSQGHDDFRESVRVFQEMDTAVTQYIGFETLLMRLGQIVETIHGRSEYVEINAHQMTTIARPGQLGEGAPEGTHQDGMDYIVSALVIERKHIHGGLSQVYGSDKVTPYLHITLRSGQGIFQTDIESPFWHSVTPIRVDPDAGDMVGQRSIFGFDIKVDLSAQLDFSLGKP